MSTVQILTGGLPVPAASRVATDQASILGDGSSENPLRASGGTIRATFVYSGQTPPVGTPVAPSSATPIAGTVTSVTKASGVNGAGAAICVGIVIALEEGGSVAIVQTTGVVTLTAAEWNAVASPSGGLVPSEAYYLDTAGHLNDAAPGTPGNFSSQVGVAFTAESLLLSTPSVPLEVA